MATGPAARRARRALAIAAALIACKGDRDKPATKPVARDAAIGDASTIDAGVWLELDGYPVVDAVRTIALPSKQDVPRFDVGGPILVGDLAVVSSSQFGFLGVDWRTGQVLWSKPSGPHVAPPARWQTSIALVGDCHAPPSTKPGSVMLGCLRIVTTAGVDEAYLGIHGVPAELGGFETSFGPQQLASDGEHIRWVRGEHAVTIDPLTGRASKASGLRAPVVVEWEGKRWDIVHEPSGKLVATQNDKPSWASEREYTALVGVVHLHRMSPMLRIANVRMYNDRPEVHLHDMDATGSMRGTSARPLPGIGLLGYGATAVGDVALAVRLDTSLARDYVAGFASTAQLLWVHPLPQTPRADPVGVAISETNAVVVFHDGDTFTILPEVSAPATAPGAGGGP